MLPLRLMKLQGMLWRTINPVSRESTKDVNSKRVALEELVASFKKMPSSGRITLEKDDETGIAVVTLDNAEQKNAITGPMIADLATCVDELESWKIGKGVILWGGKETFCSGADLNLVRQSVNTTVSGEQISFVTQDLLTRLHQLPLVSVAVISGLALGGGAELTTACDFRLMTEDSIVQFVQTRMGVVTGFGGGVRLVRLVGRVAALELLVGSKKLTADEAVHIGFSSGILSAGDALLEEARLWLADRLRARPEIVQSMKEIICQAERSVSLQEALDFERKAFAKVWGGPAQIDALKNIKHK